MFHREMVADTFMCYGVSRPCSDHAACHQSGQRLMITNGPFLPYCLQVY